MSDTLTTVPTTTRKARRKRGPLVISRKIFEMLEPAQTTARAALVPAVEDALAAVNGGAKAFTVHTWNQVAAVARDAEDRLASRGVPMTLRGGTTVTFRPAGPAAAAYRSSAISTVIQLERDNSGAWYLESVTAAKIYPKQGELEWMAVSQAALDAIVKHATRGIELHRATDE